MSDKNGEWSPSFFAWFYGDFVTERINVEAFFALSPSLRDGYLLGERGESGLLQTVTAVMMVENMRVHF